MSIKTSKVSSVYINVNIRSIFPTKCKYKKNTLVIANMFVIVSFATMFDVLSITRLQELYYQYMILV